MKNKDPSQKKKPFTVFKMLGYIFGITFLVTFLVIKGISFSSYKKTYEVYDTATVAKPILNLTFPNGYETGVVVNSYPTIQFTISNEENGKISETALEYSINIEKKSSVDGNIQYTLYKSSDSGANYTQVADGCNSLKYSPKEQLPAGTLINHFYKLEYKAAFESFNQTLFNISVDVEQVI